jgi:hypothetical protein
MSKKDLLQVLAFSEQAFIDARHTSRLDPILSQRRTIEMTYEAADAMTALLKEARERIERDPND